ncbi:MAG: dockerin type I repeat-containing protein [Oscillospiraceae bacterium]|nr:dockerin type I repeat-containing protein [Oscillospiraceae bacterium]
MKKFRFVAGIIAVMLSVQAGSPVIGNAVSDTGSIEKDMILIQNFIDENQLNDVFVVPFSSGDGILFHIERDTPETRNHQTDVLNYCYYQGFFSDYTIALEHEDWILPAAAWTEDILRNFFDENENITHIRYNCIWREDGSSYILIYKEDDSPETEEEFRFVQEYCISEGLTEHCEIIFMGEIPEEQESSEICALDTVIRAGDVTLDDNVDVLDVILLNRAILGKEKLSNIQELSADVNHDGNIDASDSLVIMKMIVGLV